MGNNRHNIIYKKICLEHFKSRVPGVVSSINEPENDVNKGNWGEIPFDLNLNEIEGLENLKKYLNDNHYNAQKVFLTEEKGENEEIKRITSSDLPEDKRLRFRNMMMWYYWVIDLCKNSTIYEWSINNADAVKNISEDENGFQGIQLEDQVGQWVVMDNFNVFDKDITNKTKLVFGFNEEEVLNGENEVEIVEWNKDNYYMIVSSEDKTYFDNHSGFELINFVETTIGRLKIPESITGNKVPEFIYFSEIQDVIDYLDKIKNAEDCCLKEEYNEMGGDEMYNYLYYHTDIFNTTIERNKKHNLVPYFDIPLVLTCDIEDLGVMFNGVQEWVAGNKYEIGEIVTYDGSTYRAKEKNNGVYNETYGETYFDSLNVDGTINLSKWEEYIDLTDLSGSTVVEGTAISQLQSFKTKRLSYTDNGYELEGILPYVNGTLKKGDKNYVTLDLPFVLNKVYDKIIADDGTSYGNVIYSMEDKDNVIRFKYVIGGKLNSNGTYTPPEKDSKITNGIHYEEAYIYSWQELRDYVDGNPVKIKYRKVNYSLNVDNGSTNVILSKVKYVSNNVWNHDAAMTAPVFRKDYMIGMSEYPMEQINVQIDRGLSHAFEKHLMLTETNTFNDLKNYKNNYFNLQ